MNWKAIRLELAGTAAFPRGSASRCYLLRLPLAENGLIDEQALASSADQATVRRYWPSEPDMLGHVIPASGGWAFSYEPDEDEDEPVSHLEIKPIRLGEHLTVTEPDGKTLPFRVASLQPLGRRRMTDTVQDRDLALQVG